MKQILILLFFACLIIACKKNTGVFNPYVNEGTTKLISITGDSVDFSYTYADNKVSDVYTNWPGDTLNRTHYAHIDYSGDNYIKVTNPQNPVFYTEYFLADLKLPLKIVEHFDSLDDKEIINFFYKPGTNLLDSVNDEVPFNQNYSSHIIFEYDGENISKMTQMRSLYGGSLNLTLYYDYAYDKTTPNIFRNSDSLLYVYNRPFGTLNALAGWAEFAAWDKIFPKMFSTATFQTTTYYRDGYPESKDTLLYTLDGNGKILSEGFHGNFYRKYFYQ